MATSLSAAASLGSWGTSVAGGEDHAMLQSKAAAPHFRVARPVRLRPVMRNVNEGKGIFAPIVVVARNIIGKKKFNQLRGKAIALHSQIASYEDTIRVCVRPAASSATNGREHCTQVITEFCKSIGADSKQRQGLIRIAKKNGERLGFLA